MASLRSLFASVSVLSCLLLAMNVVTAADNTEAANVQPTVGSPKTDTVNNPPKENVTTQAQIGKSDAVSTTEAKTVASDSVETKTEATPDPKASTPAPKASTQATSDKNATKPNDAKKGGKNGSALILANTGLFFCVSIILSVGY